MWIADSWKDYEVLDTSAGEKLERWGEYRLIRPDPQVIWNTPRDKQWRKPNAHYHRSNKGGGEWEFRDLPEEWTIHYKDLSFRLKPFNFKHTGLFPEQAANWEWFYPLIKKATAEGRKVRVLNLFAYTGGATLAAAAAGAEVTHVDASKGMVQWAKENRDLSHLEDRKIRFIVDDCLKFVEREKRRGRTYHGILMDPPSYGRGPNGEMWKFEKEIVGLIDACLGILDEHALFFLINSYTTGFSSIVLDDLMKTMILSEHPEGTVETGEVALPVQNRDLLLPCGIYGRWQRK